MNPIEKADDIVERIDRKLTVFLVNYGALLDGVATREARREMRHAFIREALAVVERTG